LTETQAHTFPDLTELDLPSTMQTHFPDPADLLNFTLTITPDEGAIGCPPPHLLADARWSLAYYQHPSADQHSRDPPRNVQGRRFRLLLRHQRQLSSRTPQGQVHAKGVYLQTYLRAQFLIRSQIYHPNVDLDGNVCLNILREDWKPVLNLNSVMVGLQYLFLEPNADDPLNKGEAFVCWGFSFF
jgi:hypothetical protein